MRLDYLKIDHFKNLNEFEVNFEETCDEPVTVLLGRNGSGKSNLFEALVIIFRDLIKGKPSHDFGYDLRYTLRGGAIRVRIWNPPPTQEEATRRSSRFAAFTAKGGEPIKEFAFTVMESGQERPVARRESSSFCLGTSSRITPG